MIFVGAPVGKAISFSLDSEIFGSDMISVGWFSLLSLIVGLFSSLLVSEFENNLGEASDAAFREVCMKESKYPLGTVLSLGRLA